MATAAPPQLRPLGVGEILDVAIKIYFRHAWTFLKIVLLIVAPTQAVASLIDISATEGALTTGAEPTLDDDDLAAAVGGTAVVAVLMLLATLLATGACFKAVVGAYLGELPSARESLAYVAYRLHSLLWIMLLAVVLGGLATLALVLPGIWLFVSWSVAIPALLSEDVRGLDALRRSFRLVRGRWWATFGIVVLGTILAGIVSGVVGALVGALTFAAESDVALFLVSFVGNTIGTVITTPFTAAFLTVLYVDLRVRKEAFDLQLLGERIGRAARPAPAPRPLES